MKKSLLVFGALALLTACHPIEGQLRVTQAFHATGWSEFDVPPGTYAASFDLSSRDQAVFHVAGVDGYDRDVYLQIPNNDHLPNYSGPIALSHTESGQPFDLRGTINTKESDSARQSGWENCTYTDYDTECGEHGCHQVPVQRPGREFAVFRFHYTDTALAVRLNRAGSPAVAATFTGQRRLAEKKYESVGICR
jgi:hypothetical protein